MLVDAHMHIPSLDRMKPALAKLLQQNPDAGMLESLNSPDALASWLQSDGIEQTWLIGYDAQDAMGYGFESVERVAAYADARPDQFIAIGGAHPDRPQTVDEVRDLGCKGWKLHPVHQHLDPADERLKAVYQRLEELRMPLIVHTGPSVFPEADNKRASPAALAPVLEAYPDLPLIIGHSGRPDRTREAVDLLRFPNAWLDLSGCPPSRLRDYFGDLEPLANRTLWGSDWPGPRVPHPAANAKAVRELLSADAAAAVLGRNASRLLAGVV